MSAYNRGSNDINTLLEVLKDQAESINDFNTKANKSLDKELRDIMIGYRDNEIQALSKTFELLKDRMPEFNNPNDNNFDFNNSDIGIGDLK